MAKLSSGTAQGMTPTAFNDYYKQKYNERMASDASAYLGEPEDLSGPIDQGVVASGQAKQQDLTQNLPEGGGMASKAGGVATTAGMATGQPELVAAGLALQTMGQIQQAKQAQRNARYTAEVNRINARQDAINRMSQIGQSLKA